MPDAPFTSGGTCVSLRPTQCNGLRGNLTVEKANNLTLGTCQLTLA